MQQERAALTANQPTDCNWRVVENDRNEMEKEAKELCNVCKIGMMNVDGNDIANARSEPVLPSFFHSISVWSREKVNRKKLPEEKVKNRKLRETAAELRKNLTEKKNLKIFSASSDNSTNK